MAELELDELGFLETAARPLPRLLQAAVAATAVLLSGFHLYTGAFGMLGGLAQRHVHLLGALILILMRIAPSMNTRRSRLVLAADLLLTVIAIIVSIYVIFETPAAQTDRAGEPNQLDMIMGVLLLILVLESTRRIGGWALPLMASVFLIYAWLGPWMPGVFQHRGFSWERIVTELTYGYEGIYGDTLGVSAAMIPAFLVLGAFMSNSGMSTLFMQLAQTLIGRVRGGPAQIAVVSSMLMGMISGSPVSNAVVTGTMTIPTMIRSGFKRHSAAAVEAVASSGGQLMPPVMGAGAFLMAQFLGVSYGAICVAAFIPAVLYYVSIAFVVDRMAARDGLRGLSRAEIPRWRTTILPQLHFLIPLVLLGYTLGYLRWSPAKSAVVSIVVLIVVFGISPKTRLSLRQIYLSVRDGGYAVMEVAGACATAGIIVGVLALTGLGVKLSESLIQLSDGSLPILLVLAMVASLILGTGAPTAAAYIVMALLVAPALIGLGVEPLAAHMFVFYFGVLANVTPPVALAAYTCAGIARCSTEKTGWLALGYSLSGFMIPFIFVYKPVLLLLGSSGVELAYLLALAFISSLVGTYALAAAVVGHLICPTGVVARVALVVGAFSFVIPGPFGYIIGFSLIGATFVWQRRLARGRHVEYE